MPVMAFPQYFSRLIPRSCSHSIGKGTQARVRDPLWFLSRQWELGEFGARNGGKITQAEVAIKTQDIDAIKMDKDKGFQKLSTLDVPPDLPLEPIVEKETDRSPEEATTPRTWNCKQLEYQFSIKGGETTLEAKEYDGDQLDWYDFNLGSGVNFNGINEEFSLMPKAISFPGMPDARWWKFDDGIVDLGDIRRTNLNFLSMLLIEFALIFSNDWFVIPLEQKVGSLRIVDKLTVIDTFGIFDEIEPIVDTSPDEHLWSMYTLSGNNNNPSAGSRLLFLPNTVVHELKGEPIEEVSINRDELANIVWAIEHKYWSKEQARVTNRDDEEAANIPELPVIDEYPLYRLKSYLPLNWIPYIPIQKSQEGGDIILRRGRTDLNASSKNHQYKGQIIDESTKINEEEVPATTIELTRRYKLIAYGQEEWQLVKVGDNEQKWQLEKKRTKKIYPWLGRNKKPAEKRGYSNLKFDYLIEK
jgi:hypothetical protein